MIYKEPNMDKRCCKSYKKLIHMCSAHSKIATQILVRLIWAVIKWITRIMMVKWVTVQFKENTHIFLIIVETAQTAITAFNNKQHHNSINLKLNIIKEMTIVIMAIWISMEIVTIKIFLDIYLTSNNTIINIELYNEQLKN